MSEVNELPTGWVWSTIAELASVGTGTTPSRTQDVFWNEGKIPWITSSAVNQQFVSEAEQYITGEALANTTLKIYPKNTLIVALYGEGKTRGKVSELLIDATINQALAALGLHFQDQSHRRFVKYFLQGNYAALRRQAAGGMQPNLNLSLVNRIRVPVAPLDEQHRIVAKIEELFSDLDAGVSALKRAKANLKRYRAAVLKAAVEGDLTEEWREKHPTKETASTLLARILKERRQKWEADQLAKFAAAKKEPPKNWKDKYVEPSPPDITGLPELPNGWCWASVEQLGHVQLGRQRSPKNRSNRFPTKYIRAANLTEDGLELDDVLDMEFHPNELETYRLTPGDILLSEASGSPDHVGKPVVWNGEIKDCCFQNTVIRLRPFAIPSEYPLTVFRHYYRSKLFAKVSAGVGINHLSAGKFSALPFPLAPLAEQKQIAAEVEERLSVIAVAQQQLESNLIRSDRLRQSILKQAFEGKLVPQDPKDEPASVLLEKLRLNQSAVKITAKAKSAILQPRGKLDGKSTQPRTAGHQRRSTKKKLEQ